MKEVKKQSKVFENYPFWIVLVSNLINLSVYFVGLYLLAQIGLVLVLLFLIYLVYNERSIYKEGCSCCYYYGKTCAFGRGRLAKLLVKRDNPKKFCEKTVSFKDFLPGSLVTLIPLTAGIYLLVRDFNWLILGLSVWPVIVMFLGNSIIYGELACPHCRQCQLCCPVAKFFMKRAKKYEK